MTEAASRDRSVRNVVLFSATPAIGIAAGLVAAKSWAILLGPAGLGLLAVAQSFLGLTVVVAAMGIGTAVIREASAAAARRDVETTTAFDRASATVTWISSIAVAIAIVLARGPVERLLFRNQIDTTALLLIVAGIVITPRVPLTLGVLNALQRVERAAILGVANVILTTAALIAFVAAAGARGIAPGIAAGALLSWLAAIACRAGQIPRAAAVARDRIRGAARVLVATGAPFMASTLLGTGAQLALPFIVLLMLDTTSVGYFRAATIFSLYLDPFLLATSQEFLPRLSGSGETSETMNHHLRILITAGVPLLFAISAASRWIIPLVYSRDFLPSVPVLRWQIIGDVLKLFGYPLGLAVLARRGSTSYLAIRVVAAAVLVGGSVAGLRGWGIRGAAMAYAGSQAVAAVLPFALLRGVRVDRRITALVAIAVAVAVAIEIA